MGKRAQNILPELNTQRHYAWERDVQDMTPAFKKLYNLVKTNSGTVFNSS
jgi:hypothetical protein